MAPVTSLLKPFICGGRSPVSPSRCVLGSDSAAQMGKSPSASSLTSRPKDAFPKDCLGPPAALTSAVSVPLLCRVADIQRWAVTMLLGLAVSFHLCT